MGGFSAILIAVFARLDTHCNDTSEAGRPAWEPSRGGGVPSRHSRRNRRWAWTWVQVRRLRCLFFWAPTPTTTATVTSLADGTVEATHHNNAAAAQPWAATPAAPRAQRCADPVFSTRPWRCRRLAWPSRRASQYSTKQLFAANSLKLHGRLAARIEAWELTPKLNGGHAKLPALIRSYEEIASPSDSAGSTPRHSNDPRGQGGTCWVESSGIVVFPALDPVNS